MKQWGEKEREKDAGIGGEGRGGDMAIQKGREGGEEEIDQSEGKKRGWGEEVRGKQRSLGGEESGKRSKGETTETEDGRDVV